MKAIRIADLKAHLSEHLRAVRRGHSLTVLDRETPIAQIVPYVSEKTSPPLVVTRHDAKSGATGRVRLPPPVTLGRDSLEFLLQERQGDR